MQRLLLSPFLFVSLLFAPLSASAAPASWIIDKAASHLGFVGKMNGEAFSGNFSRWNAQIVFDPNDLLASQVTATIDMASAKTGDQIRDEALPSEDWFAVGAFPQATFTSRSISSDAPNQYAARVI